MIRDNGTQSPIKKLYDEILDGQIGKIIKLTYFYETGQIYAINKFPFALVIMVLDSNIVCVATEKDDLTDYLAQMFFGILDAMF